jgi:hypothetical protein
MILLVLESVLTVSVEMRINKIRQSALVPSLFTSLLLIRFSCSLSLVLLFLVLSFRFFSYDTGASTHAREDCVLMSVRWQCCALCRLSCGVDVLLTFLSYGFKEKEKGKRKETKKNQTLSTVIDIDMHVCRKTITEAFVCW